MANVRRMTGPRIDRKFLVRADRWSLLSSTALRMLLVLMRVYTCPCKKVWKQKLPWPLGFYGDWSDRTGAPPLRVYTRVRGSIIPRRCVQLGEYGVQRVSEKSEVGTRKATKGRNVARIRPRGKAKQSFSSRKGNGVVPSRRIISLFGSRTR